MAKPDDLDAEADRALFAKVARRLIPLLFLGYVAAFLDRVSVGFAKLQMAGDLAFGDAVYGFGAGIFFIGYFLFEVPSNLVLRRVGARRWLARIMLSWALISAAFVFTGAMRWGGLSGALGCSDAELTFYVLRFLLGAAEAGFYPGVIYYLNLWFPDARRARTVALFMTGIAVSNVFGSPLSGAIMQFGDGLAALRGWQWLFLVEALPSLAVGILFLARLPDDPARAPWLNDEERAIIERRLSEDAARRDPTRMRHGVGELFADVRVWMLGLAYLCSTMCFYAVNFWLPTIVQEIGIPPDDYLRIGLYSIVPWAGAAVVQVAWAASSDRTGERRWHTAGGMLVALVGLLLLAFAARMPAASIAALTMITAGALGFIATFWSLPAAFLSGRGAAAGLALINAVGNLGGYLGPDLIGRIRTANAGDAEPAFLALAGAALLSVLLILALPRSRPQARGASPRWRIRQTARSIRS